MAALGQDAYQSMERRVCFRTQKLKRGVSSSTQQNQKNRKRVAVDGGEGWRDSMNDRAGKRGNVGEGLGQDRGLQRREGRRHVD